jgi:PAS domain S-box-containing protein
MRLHPLEGGLALELEARFWDLFNNVPHGLVYLDTDGIILSINPAAERILGRSSDQLKGRSVIGTEWQFIMEDGSPFPNEMHPFKLALSTAQPVQDVIMGVFELVRSGTRWIKVSASPLFRPGELRPYEVVATLVDISARKQAEETQFVDEQILTNIQDGIIIFGPDLSYRVWSPFMEKLTGVPASEVLGKHPLEVFPFLLEAGFLNELEKALAGEQSGPFDIPYSFVSTGKSGWCTDTITPFRNLQGEVIGLIVMVRDTTERKEAEAALRKSEQTYKDQFVKNSAVMLMVDPADGAIIDANEAAVRFYGYERQGLLTKRMTDLNLLSPQEVMQAISQVTTGRGERFEFQHRLADGSLRDVEVSASIIQFGGRPIIHSIIFDITSRKLAEEELSRQSGLIGSLLDSMTSIIFYKDTRGVYLGGNPAFAALAGRPREQIAGRTDYDLFDHETAEFFRGQDRQMLANLEPRQNEEWVTYPDGRKVLLSTLKTPYWGPDGRLIGLLGVSNDITERKLAEEALQNAHWRLESIIEATRAGTWEWNVQSGERVYSAAWAEIIGYTPESLAPIRDWAWETLTHPDDRKQAGEIMKRHLSDELPYYDCECRMKHKNGQWVWVSDRGRVITRSQDGRPLTVLGTMTDITERMKAVEDLRELNTELETLIQGRTHQLEQTLAALRHSEAHFRVLADSAPIFIRALDTTGQISYMNQACLDFHGLASQEEARRFDWRSWIHPEDLEKIAPWHMETYDQGSVYSWRYRILNAEGEYRWMLSKAVPDLGPHGELRGYIGSSVDITVHTQSEELLRNLEGLKAKSQIAAYIAHEINNPLAGIKQSFQVLAQGIPKEHPDYAFVGLISRELDRIASIVRMAYSIHRPGPPQVRDSNVADTLADLASLIVSRLRSKRLTLSLPEPDPALKGRIHEDILRQILFNVIQNAIEASSEDGRVTCRARREERHLVVEVEDQGPGIAPELAPKIFELGFSTKDGPEMGGLGTGLATCRSILRSIGGSIDFRNLDPGPGACFSIAIPWQ